jgi:hypothetical protein
VFGSLGSFGRVVLTWGDVCDAWRVTGLAMFVGRTRATAGGFPLRDCILRWRASLSPAPAGVACSRLCTLAVQHATLDYTYARLDSRRRWLLLRRCAHRISLARSGKTGTWA